MLGWTPAVRAATDTIQPSLESASVARILPDLVTRGFRRSWQLEGSLEYKDGTSMAAPEPKMRLGGSGSRRAGQRGSGVIPGQTQAYTAL